MRCRRPLLAVLLVLALVAVACSDDDAADGGGGGTGADRSTTEAPTTTLPAAEASTLVEEDCWWEMAADVPVEVTVTCGTVEVPADALDPDAGVVTLAVARLHHAAADPAAPPLLYLHGGPGGDRLVDAPDGLARVAALSERDLITFDQRGAGRSTPSLNCPEKEEAMLDTLARPDPWEVEYRMNRDAVNACFNRLVDEGIDLDLYDTLASVQDMEVLRETFGVETWNLWGASYGTRLGLAYAREHPDRVRSLVIDSVYAPDVGGVDYVKGLPQGALDRLIEACAEEAACAGAIGDLGARLEAAQASLDERPELLTAPVTIRGETTERTFALTGTDLRAGMFAAMYDSELIPLLPGVLDAVANSDRSIVGTFIDLGVPRLVDPSEGAFYSVECADSGRLLEGVDADAELADVGDDALVALNSAQVFCRDWEVEHLPESFNEQVTVDVPTLVYGGTLDPITPYDGSVAQAEAMPDARFVSVPHGGHGVAAFDDCTVAARATFWNDPAAPLPECTGSIAGTPFAVGG